MPDPGRPSSRWVGYVLVAAAAVSWGAQSVVAKLLLTAGLPPGSLVSTRTALACLVLLTAVAVLRPALLRIAPRDLGHAALLGVVGMAVSQYSYYVALTRIPVATAALVIYTAPLLVLAAQAALYGERLRPRDLAAAAIALGGGALLVRAHETSFLRLHAGGLLASACAAAAFAFYSLLGNRLAWRVSAWTALTYSLAAGAVFWLPLAPPWRVLLVAHPPRVWLGLAVVVAFGTLVPFALYLAGLARISAGHASVTSTLEPIVASAVAFLVLGERLEAVQLAGGALILAGIGLLHAR